MPNNYIRILTVILILFFQSCKTCIVCECYKNQSKTEEKDCLYTNDKMNASRNFQEYLIREKGYDDCRCT